ncbi:MAG TPA: ATP-binding protein [bacterium]|nr:ATP-binding protein [bacterium]
MFVKRDLEALLKKVSGLFPAIILTGPRQSGKTTFLKHTFPEAEYITFDDPVMQVFARNDPAGFISRFSNGQTILDEIQYVPELFSYLKMNIDQHRNNYGKWIITGSQQFNMMKEISDSLAGRIAILNLLPFSYKELASVNKEELDKILWNGAYPEVVLKPEIRDMWLASYIRTYIERDVRQIINVTDLSLFQTFIGLSAANHSQELNIAGISRDCGLAQPTIKRWISILETSFITYLLKPFHINIGKRLIKTPKLYFIDSAIPAYFTRQGNSESLLNGAMGGAFFEGFIVIETLKIIQNKAVNAELFFWRSNDGMEIDLIIEFAGKYHAIEIKKTQTPTAKHAESIDKFISLFKEKTGDSFVVCNIPQTKPLTANVSAISWKEYFKRVEEILGFNQEIIK